MIKPLATGLGYVANTTEVEGMATKERLLPYLRLEELSTLSSPF
jgi:hypothetical protein